MNQIKLILAIIGLSLFFNSCTDQLDVDPTSVITTESFWQSEGDARGALGGMYVDLRDVANSSLYILGEARSDVLTLGTVGEGGWSKYYSNTLQPSDAGPTWESFYTLVNSANLLIKYVPDIEFSSENQKNNILAQAYTMRAFAYYVMTRSWGTLPLRREPTEGTDAETTQKERTSQEDIFAFIKEDLDRALPLYSDDEYSEDRSMWSRPAANALKADVYLWTGKRLQGGDPDIEVALTALNEIENTDIALLENYSDIFQYSNKGNREILMAVRFEEFQAGSNYFNDMYIINSSIPSNISQETREIIGPVGPGNNIVVPTEYLKSLFTEDDSRKDASYYEIYTLDDQGNPSEYYTTIVLKGDGLVTGGTRLFIDDVILYRYADILLMKAEAKNALDQDPSDEINMVRARAYGSSFQSHMFTSGTRAENDEAILEERLRELAFEGKRWWDLIRFGKAVEMISSLQDKENPEHLLLWPISNSVLSLENQVEQNPGY